MSDSVQPHRWQPTKLSSLGFSRQEQWVAISFSNAWKWKVKMKSLSRVWLLATPWTAAYQAPPSMRFSRQEDWSGVPLPSPKVYLVSTRSSRSRLNMLNLSRQIILPNILSFVEAFVQFSSVVQSCPTLCNPMDFSMPGFPVHHQLPELTQTHVHWVGNAIQPSYLLLSLFLPHSVFPSIRVFANESALLITWPKY